jgi:hypothetical protein
MSFMAALCLLNDCPGLALIALLLWLWNDYSN